MAYNLLRPVALFSSLSMATSQTSRAVEIKNQDNIGLQVTWAGAPTGAFSVQISSDHIEDIEGNIQVAGHWVTLPLSPAVTASGTPDDAYIDLNQMSAQYVRLVYTAASGAGTMTALAVGKGV